MRRRLPVRPALAVLLLTAAAACAPLKDGPSLAPRAAEAIDPRLPIPDRAADLPPTPAFLAALEAVRSRALAGADVAEPAIRTATAAAAGAGPVQSESWITAQEQLSAAIAARAALVSALGDLDALVSRHTRSAERLVAQDLAAARRVNDELGAIDRRQLDALDAIKARLQR
ncbi:hypothetical protein [Sphingomonas sp. LHG3406-1]|uniref:hypothetical protein n=1 Tax=Sphingomonas sp. LHG3406-1 TaxID=2804617 RepID=UPI002627A1B5|nr:hypothetical protein [Sphingomonas sp. LHG3406-1]